MEVKIEVVEYNPENGFNFNWKEGYELEVKVVDGCSVISANQEGLISLARILLTLSQDTVPVQYHVHLDEFNSLNDGSNELIIQKK